MPSFAALALVAATGLAQTNGAAAGNSSTPGRSDETVVLDPFTVNVVSNGYATDQTMSGSRTAQSLNDIPISVGIINAEQLSDLHAVNSSQAITYGAPGFSPNTQVSDDYNVRGFRTEFVLQDGVTITQTELKPLYDIDRVEVIRGPIATTLGTNGSDFLGGVINFITRQPTATPQGYVSATGGNHGYLRFEGNASGPLYKDEDMDTQYRVTLGGTKATPQKKAERLNEQFIGAGFKALLGPGRRSEFDFYGAWYAHRNYIYYEDFLDINSVYPGSTLHLNPYSTRSFSSSDPANSWYKYTKFVVQGIYKAQVTAHTNLRLLVEETGAKDRRMTIRGITINPDNVTLQRQAIPFDTYKYFATAMLDITNHHDLDFLVNDFSTGIEDDDTGSTQWQNVFTAPAINVLHPDFSQDYLYTTRDYFNGANGSYSQNRANNFAGYLEDNVSLLNDRVILVAGTRVLDSRATNLNQISRVYSDRSAGRENTHKYGIVVKPIKGIAIYYSEGTDFIPLTGFLVTGAPEVPQIGGDSEWGVKWDYALNDRVHFFGTADHFDTRLTNVVTTATVIINGTPIAGNVQNAQNSTGGYELQIGAGIGFGDSRIDLVGGLYNATTNVAGSILPAQDAVPWSYSLLAKYSIRGLMIGAGVYDQGKRLELSTSYVETPVLINAFAGYQFDRHWSLQVNVDNVTDQYYIAGIAANGLVEASPTRSIQGELRYKW